MKRTRGFARCLLLSAIACPMVYVQPYRLVTILGTSMSPNYSNFSMVMMTTRFLPDQIHRNDIVVFRHKGQRYIKRVGFLAGDTIKGINVRKGRSTSKWVWLYYPVALKKPDFFKSRLLSVPPGTLFALSDNQGCVTDSRSLGPIPLSEIEGVIVNPRANPN